MMLIFVYEHMNSGVYAGAAGAESLHKEGRAMLTAVLEDFQRCAGVETVTLLDRRQSAPGRVVHAAGAAEEEAAFRAQARAADRTLVIAPETAGVLEARCRWVEESNGRLLGPSSAAVHLTADKLALATNLASRGVPTPPTQPITPGQACPFPFPVVVKPRFGAGSVATFRIATDEIWRRLGAAVAVEGYDEKRVVQPFVSGRAASVAVLIGPTGALSLPPAEQHLSADDRCHYEGGSIPLPSNEARRARRLAERAVSGIFGLRGFVGIDLVVGMREDGLEDAVIEINPRLTTSYVGLRALARFNLAEAMLAMADGMLPPSFEWHAAEVRWKADGSVCRGS
jgi:predicted ATP-grasp superfamily ATP-dependent carboligase